MMIGRHCARLGVLLELGAMEQSLRRLLVGGAVSLLMLGAGYLYAARGEAILIDLAGMGRALLCL